MTSSGETSPTEREETHRHDWYDFLAGISPTKVLWCRRCGSVRYNRNGASELTPTDHSLATAFGALVEALASNNRLKHLQQFPHLIPDKWEQAALEALNHPTVVAWREKQGKV